MTDTDRAKLALERNMLEHYKVHSNALADVRDILLGNIREHYSDDDYEHWLFNTVPNPGAVPEMLEWWMEQEKKKNA